MFTSFAFHFRDNDAIIIEVRLTLMLVVIKSPPKTRKPVMFFEVHLLSFKILDRPKKSTKPHPHEEVGSLPLCLRETDRIYIE